MYTRIAHLLLTVLSIGQISGIIKYIKASRPAIPLPMPLAEFGKGYVNARGTAWTLQQMPTVTANKPNGIKLPSRYLQGKLIARPKAMRRQQFAPPRRNNRNMPTFDYVPGQDTNEQLPLFVYSGAQGELLLNTMLSTQRYPMQEPIPGQILYPPTTPLFRVKPAVSNARAPHYAKQLNVTLIPFYAHEAITPSYASVAAVNAPSSVPKPTRPKKKRKMHKKRKHKRGKQYAVYRAADEVHWLPSTVDPLSVASAMLNGSTTTPFPLALASPLEAQQQWAYGIKLPTPTAVTAYGALPTQNAASTAFLINYAEESLEKPAISIATTSTPTTKQRFNLLSARYTTATPSNASPVYTLGKLLKNDTPPSAEKENAPSTWFILNSRYKGHLTHNAGNSYSSKYTKNTATQKQTAS